jgi:hypothetical protein
MPTWLQPHTYLTCVPRTPNTNPATVTSTPQTYPTSVPHSVPCQADYYSCPMTYHPMTHMNPTTVPPHCSHIVLSIPTRLRYSRSPNILPDIRYPHPTIYLLDYGAHTPLKIPTRLRCPHQGSCRPQSPNSSGSRWYRNDRWREPPGWEPEPPTRMRTWTTRMRTWTLTRVLICNSLLASETNTVNYMHTGMEV